MPATVLLLLLSMSLSICAAESQKAVQANNGMVVCDQKLAAEIGGEVLESGGNAVDAAVATAFAMAVVFPRAGNLGGGGFLVYQGGDGEALTVDFRETAPSQATERMFLDEEGKIRDNSNHEGLLSVGVPGTVAGLLLAHDRLGSKPLNELIQPAIDLAREGFPVSKTLSRDLRELRPALQKYPSSARAFLKEGNQPYKAGEILRQADLAGTLERIRDGGRRGFYEGRTAELIVGAMEKGGGMVTIDDLAEYRAVVREPIHGTYRGYDIYAMGPPSSGGVAIAEMLNILEGYDLGAIGHNSAAYMHILTETMRRAFADRAHYLGDPDRNPDMPIERLTSKKHAATLRKTIDESKASKSDADRFNSVYEGIDTTHLSVVDKNRSAVSLTYTIEQPYGSKIVVEGAGFLLNNEMGDFNPIPGHTDTNGLIGTPPNFVAPGKRMLSSMTPTIVAKGGKPVLVLGSPGGRTIINTVLQVILNTIDHEMPIDEAVAAGRFHHQWMPDVTTAEKSVASWRVRWAYRAYGHKLKRTPAQGRVMAIEIDADSGTLRGMADPRSPDAAAMGY